MLRVTVPVTSLTARPYFGVAENDEARSLVLR